MILTANEVKTKGVSIFNSMLEKAQEIFINVRGKNEFVVIDVERYNKLRELELENAYQDALLDIEQKNFKILGVEEHLAELENAIQTSSN